jgi:uncharacterized Zn finger protein
MPITILDYVRSQVGDKLYYSAQDFTSNGVEVVGGCERCPAVIAAYNAYPSRSGYWRCAECIEDTGYSTAEEYRESLPDAIITCPACGEVSNVTEIRVSDEHTEGYAFECGECGAVWP